jgi:DNA invertase Pin-like site-specific DNA recombinase|tara:strand:+ start:3163 stop:3786 length:624 start_codon:yes stop_codon:yes gene_type:complete
MIKAYARISTTAQNVESQIDRLKENGFDEIYTDKISGKSKSRPQLDEMLKSLRSGDQVLIYRLDRLGRSISNLLEIMQLFEEKGVSLHSLSEDINTSTASGKLIFHIFASLADFEHNLIVERTMVGLKAAKARGRVGGRKKGLSDEAQAKAELAYNLYHSEKAKDKTGQKKRAVDVLCAIVGVSRKTFYNYVAWHDKNTPEKQDNLL